MPGPEPELFVTIYEPPAATRPVWYRRGGFATAVGLLAAVAVIAVGVRAWGGPSSSPARGGPDGIAAFNGEQAPDMPTDIAVPSNSAAPAGTPSETVGVPAVVTPLGTVTPGSSADQLLGAVTSSAAVTVLNSHGPRPPSQGPPSHPQPTPAPGPTPQPPPVPVPPPAPWVLTAGPGASACCWQSPSGNNWTMANHGGNGRPGSASAMTWYTTDRSAGGWPSWSLGNRPSGAYTSVQVQVYIPTYMAGAGAVYHVHVGATTVDVDVNQEECTSWHGGRKTNPNCAAIANWYNLGTFALPSGAKVSVTLGYLGVYTDPDDIAWCPGNACTALAANQMRFTLR